MLTCYGLLVLMWCSEPTPRAPAVHCPPLAVYSERVQKEAADELRRLPAGSPTRRLITDYGTIRARCRALEGGT